MIKGHYQESEKYNPKNKKIFTSNISKKRLVYFKKFIRRQTVDGASRALRMITWAPFILFATEKQVDNSVGF